MADAFKALRAPITPVDPDPAFAARLRRRIQRALTLPKGVDIMTTTLEPEPAAAIESGLLTPYLAVADARGALAWYADTFGARPRMEPIVMPNGRIGHAELALEGAVIMLADEYPEIGFEAPGSSRGSAVLLHWRVTDVDAVVDRAVAAGARLDRPPADYDYGRNAAITDPFGHRWILSGQPVPAAPVYSSGTRHGDIGHISFEVPDLGRAMAFYQAVLGWTYQRRDGGGSPMVAGVTPAMALAGGKERGLMVIAWRVDDVAAAVASVREAGGTAGETVHRPYGVVVDCVDQQGSRFALWEPSDAERAKVAGVADRPVNGTRQGDISYLTLEIRDSAQARALYQRVLGWEFMPGRVEDGWQVQDTMPMTGLSGGHPIDTAVPMFRVDDLASAVQRVLAAGGTATLPEPQPYGLTSTCTDDQGTRFYLGQL